MFSAVVQRGARGLARQTMNKALIQHPTRVAARRYFTVGVWNRNEVQDLVDRLHNSVMGTNWQDYLQIVQNMPFWEAEMEKLNTIVQPYLADEEIGKKWEYTLQSMDCLYACEDVRDHMNELLELKTRNGGMMNMGINAGPEVDNMKEQLEMCATQYDWLLETYPQFKPKIEMAVGHGLATMRQKWKFDFKSKHLFFY